MERVPKACSCLELRHTVIFSKASTQDTYRFARGLFQRQTSKAIVAGTAPDREERWESEVSSGVIQKFMGGGEWRERSPYLLMGFLRNQPDDLTKNRSYSNHSFEKGYKILYSQSSVSQ